MRASYKSQEKKGSTGKEKTQEAREDPVPVNDLSSTSNHPNLNQKLFQAELKDKALISSALQIFDIPLKYF